MPTKVSAGTILRCSCGELPVPLNVLPIKRVMTTTPAATTLDNSPVNIPSFGVCALSGLPCIPAPIAPWIVGNPTVLVGKEPSLNQGSQLVCVRGGIIETIIPSQVSVQD